jgi:hypothetical protein
VEVPVLGDVPPHRGEQHEREEALGEAGVEV